MDIGQWSMPQCQHSDQNITSWHTKVPAAGYRPPNFENYYDYDPHLVETLASSMGDNPNEKQFESYTRASQLADAHLQGTENAQKLQHPTGAGLQPWLWTCRIYARVPEIDPATSNVKLNNWIFATASLVHDAHGAHDNSQWLLTVAHNLVSVLQCTISDHGNVTNKRAPMVTVADAIMIAVGWGEHTRVGWVDRASVMSDYFSVNSGNAGSQRFDGAALHIANSAIPESFWQLAPAIGTVIPRNSLLPEITRSSIFYSPGFPGDQNLFRDLAGLYIAGKHVVDDQDRSEYEPVKQTVLKATGDFQHVRAGQNEEAHRDEGGTYQRCLKWDNKECFMAPGQSGSPCVVAVDGVLYVVAGVSTNGVGAPFSYRFAGRPPATVDPLGLLRAVGVPDAKLQTMLMELGPAQAKTWSDYCLLL